MTTLHYAASIPPQERSLHWAPYYRAIHEICGDTVTLLDFLNPRTAKLNAATFPGRRYHANGLAPTWTLSEALSAFDTPFRSDALTSYLGLAPILNLNGTDEEADTPDADYFTIDDSGGSGPASWWFWINPTDVTSTTLLSKYDETTSAELREWRVYINGSSKLALALYDESANVEHSRPSSASIVANQCQFCCVTYSGAGGAAGADGINLYIKGAVSNGTAANNGSYVALENLSTIVRLGHYLSTGGTATGFYAGGMLGGPWSPGMAKAELTAAQVKNLYEEMRMGLGI